MTSAVAHTAKTSASTPALKQQMSGCRQQRAEASLSRSMADRDGQKLFALVATRMLAAIAMLSGASTGCARARQWADEHAAERDAERARAAAVHASEPSPIHAIPNGHGLPAGRYRIVDVRVEALPTDERGRPWDPDSDPDPAPDLRVTVTAGSVHGTCRIPDNRFEGRCTLGLEIEINAATRIDVDVVDRDPIIDDPIGGAKLEDPQRWDTEMVLPMMPSGRLRAAALVLARVPGWWAIYYLRVVGLASGVAVVLVLLALFRRTFFATGPDEPAPREIWRGPLLIAAGVIALVGVAVAAAVLLGALPEPWGPAIQLGLGGASLTFTMARIVRTGRVGSRELELLIIALAVILAHLLVLAVASLVVVCIIAVLAHHL